MSLRRGKTVSPLTGWPWKAVPVLVQSFRVPVSKSRLSGLPSAPVGRTPSSAGDGRTRVRVTKRASRARRGIRTTATGRRESAGLGLRKVYRRGGGIVPAPPFFACILRLRHDTRWRAFVSRLTVGGTGLIFSSVVGLAADTGGRGIALDGAGTAYLTGYDVAVRNPKDVLVVKINA